MNPEEGNFLGVLFCLMRAFQASRTPLSCIFAEDYLQAMRSLCVNSHWCGFCASVACLLAEILSCAGDDIVTASLYGSYEVTQHYRDDRDGWAENLNFKNSKKPVVLEAGISWPAFFYISPD